jgi:hypothetical protein
LLSYFFKKVANRWRHRTFRQLRWHLGHTSGWHQKEKVGTYVCRHLPI